MIERSISSVVGVLVGALLSIGTAGAQTVRLHDDADPVLVFAKEELRRYARQMGVVEEPLKVAIHGDLTTLETSIDAPTDETFYLEVDRLSGTVEIAGATPRAALYGVYAFLEQQGCRFFGPGPLGEIVPTRKNWHLESSERVESPAMHTREIGGGAPQGIDPVSAIDWRTKNRLNRAFALRSGKFTEPSDAMRVDAAWRKRGGTRHWQWIAHNFGFIFPPEESWFEQHPEYFALYQGRRRRPGSEGRPYYGGGNLALTNADVIDHTAAFVQRWFHDHPDGEVVPLWPNDGAIYWDESTEAMKLGGTNFTTGAKGSMTGRMVYFANEVARRIASKSKPNQRILLPAYANYLIPLDEAKLEPNIMVQYCFHGDYAHGPTRSKHNALAVEQMRRWASQAKDFGVWEYFLIGDFHQSEDAPVLLPLVYRIRDTMRFLHDIGCKHYFTQSNPAYQTYNPLVYHALARFAWNPTQDADALIADFCHHSFGPDAGPPMEKFYRAMEIACQESKWSPMTYGEVVVPSPLVFTPELLERLDSLLDRASAYPLSMDQRQRLQSVRIALDATKGAAKVARTVDLTGKGQWRLLRTSDAYVIHPDGPVVDSEQFAAMVQEASDRGGGGPALQRTAFRCRRRVADMERIENGGLQLAVIPELGGRAVRLIDSETGWNYLAEGPASQVVDRLAADYLNYGGYETYVGRQFGSAGWEQSYRVLQKAESQIELESVGDGWKLNRVYRLNGHPKYLEIRETLTNTTSQSMETALRTHPQFCLGGDVSKAMAFRMDASGRWRKIDTLGGMHDQMRPASGNLVDDIAVWQASESRGLMLRTMVQKASEMPNGYTFVSPSDHRFQLECLGPTVRIDPGDAYKLVQRIMPLDAPSRIGLPVDTDLADSGDYKEHQQEPIGLISGGAESKASGSLNGHMRRGDQWGACFDDTHRLVVPTGDMHVDAGTVAAWVHVPTDDGTCFLVSSGDNRDAWLALSVDREGFNWLAKLGQSPYQGPGEAYVSVNAGWELDRPSVGSIGRGDHSTRWHHVAFAWQHHPESAVAELTLWLDGKVAQRRSDLRWPCGFPSAPLIVGGNSASGSDASPIAIDDLIILDHALDQDEVAMAMNRPQELAGIQLWFDFQPSSQKTK
ncbi:DUF4838 domain-containing protein [Crateriforma conspicua]|uniref:LamG-like jellyroll fold domain-containing protein n=1 Tax=Crateriforma conspicua TaxID=2527996 RepID=A0A5C5Y6H5_9PLAN|nr:DUF4838 domain-containing protein [Crateriforma conspicua]TWT69022.1 hypothetical protein Pan14r_13060 [Crateriforma conspicua]